MKLQRSDGIIPLRRLGPNGTDETSEQLARDDALRERLLAEHPITYERYWRGLARWN